MDHAAAKYKVVAINKLIVIALSLSPREQTHTIHMPGNTVEMLCAPWPEASMLRTALFLHDKLGFLTTSSGFSQERRAKGSCCVGLPLGPSCLSRGAATALPGRCRGVAAAVAGALRHHRKPKFSLGKSRFSGLGWAVAPVSYTHLTLPTKA